MYRIPQQFSHIENLHVLALCCEWSYPVKIIALFNEGQINQYSMQKQQIARLLQFCKNFSQHNVRPDAHPCY